MLFEYLHTTHQNMDPPYINDAYYNHSEYTLGWSYKNYTLGNPFINHLNVEPINVLHIGIDGEIAQYLYHIKLSKRTNMNDSIKYKIVIGKKIDTKNRFPALNIFIVNNKEKSGLGVDLNWKL